MRRLIFLSIGLITYGAVSLVAADAISLSTLSEPDIDPTIVVSDFANSGDGALRQPRDLALTSLEPIYAEPVVAAEITDILEECPGRRTWHYEPIRLSQFTIQYANDAVHAAWFRRQDRHFTAGAQLYAGFEGSKIDALGKRLPFDFGANSYAAGWGTRLQIFTPDDIRTVMNPGPDERPYAGILLTSFALQRRNNSIEDHFGIDLGIVGPSSGAAEIQTTLHDALGWHTQLRDEPLFNFRYRRAWRSRPWVHPACNFALQAIPEASFDVGNLYRRATAGVTLRAGYVFPDDFLLPTMDDPGSLMNSPAPPGGYLFLRGQIHVVEHNLLLDGNTWKTSRSVSAEPIVSVLSAGFVYRPATRTEIIWQFTTITDEFKTDLEKDTYGTILMRLTY